MILWSFFVQVSIWTFFCEIVTPLEFALGFWSQGLNVDADISITLSPRIMEVENDCI